MAAPEISVIVPTFGRSGLVERAVDSALAQDAHLEVLVVDDASPVAIAIDRARVRVVRLDTNLGAAGARNAGAAAARGEWLAFLDSDDAWIPHSLAPRLAAARATKEGASTIWCAGFTDAWPDGRRVTRVPRASASLSDFASGCWTCPGSTALLTREAWRRSGGQDQRLRRLEDYDWLLRWVRAGGKLDVHDGAAAQISRGSRASPEAIAEASKQIVQKFADLEEPLRRRMQSYLALEMAAARIGAGDVMSGAAALSWSWVLHPRLQFALEPFWRARTEG